MMDTTVSNLHKSFYIPEIQKLEFHIPYVQIMDLVELFLNAANYFKMCYVTMKMPRG